MESIELIPMYDVRDFSDWLNQNRDEVKSLDLYDHVVKTLEDDNKMDAGTKLIYMLNLYGFDINSRNNTGNTPLQQYLQGRSISPKTAEAFLRCGADPYLPNKDGRTAFALAYFNPRLSKTLKSVFMKYVPGLWRAVEGDDVMNVRKLVNQWCHTKINKDGKSLQLQVNETGSENVVRVVRDIVPSMNLAHAALATDIHHAREVLTSGEKVNVNFRNMGENGATPLFYAMMNNDLDMINLLLENGARADIPMSSGDAEIPLFLETLRTPGIHPDTFSRVINKLSGSILSKMFYLGSNVLLHGVNSNVDPQIIGEMLKKGGAVLLTYRDQDNMTVRDVCELIGNSSYLEVIDKTVCTWCYGMTKDDTYRRLLSLHSYPHIPTIRETTNPSEGPTHGNQKHELEENVFKSQLKDYNDVIESFHYAVETSDLERVNELIYVDRFSSTFEPCLVDSRTKKNFQPALHKAVLRGDREILKVLVEAYLFLLGLRLDSVRDQFHRTALHYAMAMENGEDMVAYLSESGSSEHVMDKDSRSPQIFKDRKNLAEMKNLLRYHYLQNFEQTEPDPWSVSLPIPIIAHMEKCSTNHKHGITGSQGHSHSHAHHTHTPGPVVDKRKTLYLNYENESNQIESTEESETESHQDDQLTVKDSSPLLTDSGRNQRYGICYIL